MLETPKHFVSELAKWRKAGYPVRPAALVQQLFGQYCKPCPNFQGGNRGGRCSVCSCRISRDDVYLNKLAMATTRCPLPKPKWVEYNEATEFYVPPEDTKYQSKSGCCQ